MPYQVTAGRFVGRTEELAQLRDLLARAANGQPQVAVIGGEAGIGKTRLTEELAHRQPARRSGAARRLRAPRR
jgi:predicted ATPase